MEAVESPRISVIIAHSRDVVRHTLDSLARQTFDHRAFEVFVIGGSPEHVNPDAYDFAVRYFRCDDMNPSRRRNIGIQASKAEIIAFIDDDATADDDWLRNAMRLFDEDPTLGVIGGPTFLPPGAGLGEHLTYKIGHAGFFGNGHENLKADSDVLKKVVGYITSCNMLVNRARLSVDNHFESQIGYGGEDTLFIYRAAHLLGCRVLYSMKVIVFHSRKAFGFRYLATRFKYRVNNGMMLWARPGIYLGNKRFSAGLTVGGSLLAGALIKPILLPLMIVLHQIISLGFALNYLKEDYRLTLLFPPALLIQHMVYFCGIVVGFVSLVHPAQRARVRQIRANLK
jgi:glycosyltransferase involved in cell wall biosynthesis